MQRKPIIEQENGLERKRRELAQDASAASKRAYYEAHKADIAKKGKAYYEAHKADIKAYYEAHKADISKKGKAYYEAHKADIAKKGKAYYEAHKADISARMKVYGKAYYEAHKADKKAYREAHKADISKKGKAYREAHKADIKASDADNALKAYYLKQKEAAERALAQYSLPPVALQGKLVMLNEILANLDIIEKHVQGMGKSVRRGARERMIAQLLAKEGRLVSRRRRLRGSLLPSLYVPSAGA